MIALPRVRKRRRDSSREEKPEKASKILDDFPFCSMLHTGMCL